MSEPWFRMHANILDKPVTWRLAEATGIHPVKAAGHLAAFWGKVSQHGSHGRVADLPDTQLEAWAGWDGKRGAFATWLRAAHLTDGVVNEYDEYSGALEAHREKTRQRVKRWRTERERNAHANDDVTRTVTVTDASRNNVTIRDDTKRVVTTPPSPPDGGDVEATVGGVSSPPDRPVIPKRKKGALTPTADELAVHAHYKSLHPRCGPLDDAQTRKLRAALAVHSVAECCQIIDGNHADEWAVKVGKHELTWIFRNADNMTRYLEIAQRDATVLVDENLQLTEAGRRAFGAAA